MEEVDPNFLVNWKLVTFLSLHFDVTLLSGENCEVSQCGE